KYFEGTQDFRSFASTDGTARTSDPDEKRSTVRTIFSSTLERRGQQLVYTVRGDGFLNHMVRNIVGTLIEVGRGNISVEEIASILKARDRSAAGPTAPARGLHLICVNYASDVTILVREMRAQEAAQFLAVHHEAVRGIAAKDYSPEVIDEWAPISISDE